MRERFPMFTAHPNFIYFDSAATTHKPKEMIDALSSFYANEYATVHRAVYRTSMAATEKYNAAREASQQFLHAAHTDEIIFTRGTTSALNLIAQSYGRIALSPGDEILITEMEHHSNIVPWQMIAQETGAVLRWMRVDEQGVLQWQGTITPRTKIVALAHVSNVLGTVNPIAEIAQAAHAVGSVVVVDGAQAAPHMQVDVQALDCDFYAFSGHKCYGPTGVGILYGKQELLEKMPPVEGGGDMIERVTLDQTTYRKPPLRFEAGTPIIGSVIALKSALDFIEDIGLQTIANHEHKLLIQAAEQLSTIAGLRILGTAQDKGPIITFMIEGVHPLDAATMLDLHHIAIRSGHLCAQPILRRFGLESAMRISFGIYNTSDEIDRFVSALKRVLAMLRKKSIRS